MKKYKLMGLNVVLCLLAIVFLIIDLSIPLGVAAGVPYVTVILLSLTSKQQSITWIWACICTLLTVLGFYASPVGGEVWKVVSNRILAIYAIWAVAIVSIYWREKALKVLKLEADLKISEFRSTLGQVAEYAKDAVVITDAKGETTWVNEAFTKLSGFNLEEVKGKRPGDILQGPETDIDEIQRLSLAVAGGEHIQSEIVNYHKNGTPYWIDIAISPVFEGEQLVKFVAVERDITERKMLEIQLAREVEKTKLANHTKSQFLTLMTHELSTPINGIVGSSQIIELTDNLDECHQLAKQITQSGEVLHSIIRNIIELASIEHDSLVIEQSRFNLFDLLEPICKDIKIMANGKNLDFTSNIQLSDDLYLGDQKRIRQVLYFFMVNALTSTTNGQINLSVTCQRQPTNQKIQFELTYTDGGESCQYIMNTINPLESNDSQYMGLGLGYSVSKQIAKKLGGDIQLIQANSSHSGVVFTIELERYSESPVSNSKHQFKVLVVDDNHVNAKLLTMMLKTFHCSPIDRAEDGEEAVGMVSETEYDIIFMDNHMPKMTGLEATYKIKKEMRKSATIIGFTADVAPEVKQEYLNNGAVQVIYKPIKKATVANLLKELESNQSLAEKDIMAKIG